MVVDKCTKKIKLNHKNRKRSSWITMGLISSITKRDRLYKIYQDDPNNINLKTEFLNYRNKLNELIKVTKINYYKSKIAKNNGNSKKLWNIIKEISNCERKDNLIKEIKTESGTITSNDEEKANIFVNYFTNVGKNLATQIKKTYFIPPRQSTNFSFFLAPTNKREVEDSIKSLKNNKAPGYDMIKAETLKNIAEEISPHIAFLINMIFDTGIYPSAFKTAVIQPLYKNGDKTETCNYRPISIISSLSKIVEKILKFRINEYTKKYKLISNRQYGFQEGKSTQDAIACLTSEIYESLDKSKSNLCVFLDLAKAFDTVSHPQLLEALEDMGFRGPVLKLIRNYLNDRKQMVKIGSVFSNECVVEYGVPQGTVLGPILFILYLNNLFALKTKGTVISFADDTVIFYEDKGYEDLKIRAEEDLKQIKNWFDCKLLTINFAKTKYISFSCYDRNLYNFSPLKIDNDTEIQQTDSVKYLGITIDRFMRWDLHINNVCNTVRSILFRFKFLKSILDLPNLKTIYYSLVESRLSYGIIGWGSAVNYYIKKLEIIQKKFLKIMLNKVNTYPSDNLYIDANVLDIRQLFYYTVVINLYNKKNTLRPVDHTYQTRTREVSYRTPFSVKSIGQRSVSYLSPRFYNFLPDEVKNINSFNLFKKRVKIFILGTNRIDLHKLVEIKN